MFQPIRDRASGANRARLLARIHAAVADATLLVEEDETGQALKEMYAAEALIPRVIAPPTPQDIRHLEHGRLDVRE